MPAELRSAFAPSATKPPITDPLITEALHAWAKQLVDLSARNRLLAWEPLERGTLLLTDGVVTEQIEVLRSGDAVRLRDLVPPDQLEPTVRSVRRIQERADENLRARGVHTAVLAEMTVTWIVPEGAPVPCAPLLLRPLTIRQLGRDPDELEVQVTGSAVVNDVLLFALESAFGVSISADALLEEREGPTVADVHQVARRLLEQADAAAGLAVTDALFLDNLGFQRLPLLRDLERNHAAIARHPVARAVAGDRDAQLAASSAWVGPAREDRSQPLPVDELLVLDADASQAEVIERALNGEGLVVQGPPGTGKSQTIANLIAALAASGRSVLFVVEKRAAVEAVMSRLEQIGLGRLVADLHGRESATRDVYSALERALLLDLGTGSPPRDRADLLARHSRTRRFLGDAERVICEPTDTWPSLLDLAEDEARLDRFRGRAVALPTAVVALDDAAFDDLAHELRTFVEATADGPLIPPAIAEVATRDETSFLEVCREIDQVLRSIDTLRAELGPPGNDLETLDEWEPCAAACATAIQALERLSPAVFDLDLVALSRQLPEGADLSLRVTSSYREAERQIASVTRDDAPPTEPWRLAAAARRAQRVWHEAFGLSSHPRAVSEGVEAVQALTRLRRRAAADAAMHSWVFETGTADLARQIGDLLTSPGVLHRQVLGRRARTRLAGARLTALLEAVRTATLDADEAVALLHYSRTHARLQQVLHRSEPEVSRVGRDLAAVSREFRALDTALLASNAVAVLGAARRSIDRALDEYPEQALIVRREANRTRGRLAVRDLFANASDVVTALVPCWVMSPLQVAGLLPGEQPVFDVVVFDEASQITPADGVGSLLRARQPVVCGDPHQLPPTRFFERNEHREVDDPDALTEGFESLLDVLASVLPTASLSWHYRSADDRLIEFSNREFYGGRLIAFPSASLDDALLFVRADREEGASGEVQEVLDLARELRETDPSASIGIVTLGLRHADRLRDALDSRAQTDEAFRQLAAEDPSTFFIRNLERVQGDERDLVVLSPGIEMSAVPLSQQLGPLRLAGGERRLNVAITRARKRAFVVTSVDPEDHAFSTSSSRGVWLFGEYLCWAARRPSADGVIAPTGGTPDGVSEVAQSIARRLQAEGFDAEAGLGHGRARIDVAFTSPQGERIAVDLDFSVTSTTRGPRERERLRQAALEHHGWRVVRVRLLDWLRDPQGTVNGLLERVRSGVHA